MATYNFNGSTRTVGLTETSLDVLDMYREWKEWARSGGGVNSGRLFAFYNIGGEPTVNPRAIAITVFITNGWSIVPMDINHVLSVDGNLYRDPDDNSGAPIFADRPGRTILIDKESSSLAQALYISSTGGGSGLTPVQVSSASITAIASAVTNSTQATQIDELHKIQGLQPASPLIVTPTSRQAGDISQTIDESGNTVTVERQ